jgi:hypothetical protein
MIYSDQMDQCRQMKGAEKKGRIKFEIEIKIEED